MLISLPGQAANHRMSFCANAGKRAQMCTNINYLRLTARQNVTQVEALNRFRRAQVFKFTLANAGRFYLSKRDISGIKRLRLFQSTPFV